MTRLTTLFLAWVVLAGVAHAEVRNPPPADAWRIVLEKFMNGRDDLVVMVFVREGQASHAYAQAAGGDQTMHRIDLTPAAPIEYLIDGKPFIPPANLKSDYDYKKEEFLRYREMHAAGKLVMRNYDPPQPLAISDKGATGVIDLFLDGTDMKKRDRFRIVLDLKPAGGRLAGAYRAHDYDRHDQTFSVKTEKFEGKAAADHLKDHWNHTPQRDFAAGKDWPQTHGPTLSGSAIDCEQPLVDNIADARLLWVADMPIPGGRGGIPRSPFGFFPINNSGLGITQFSAPIVVGAKVYLSLPYVDEAALAANEQVKSNPRVIRGADPRAVADELGLFRDTLFCIDAQTGRVLWVFQDPRRMGLVGESKSGRGLTAVHHEGKIIFRGQTSLYAVDAATGKLIWQNNGVAGKKGGEPGYSFGDGQAWSTDHSPVVIDGVVVVRVNDTPKPAKNEVGLLAENTTLLGFDPANGKLLWRASNVSGVNAIPTSVIVGGKPFIIAAYQGLGDLEKVPAAAARPEHRGMLSLIEPRTGRIVWSKPLVGPNSNYPAVWEDIVALNVDREKTEVNPKGKKVLAPTLGAVRVGLADAKEIWRNEKADYQYGRMTPIAHRGHFILDSRESGFQAFEAATGKVVGRFPHIYHMAQGSHNWTWTIASNGRIFTSGDHLLMFKLEGGKMELMPGSLRVDLASGYVCPIRPAIADGRLFVRTGDGLACYDLRKPAGHRVDSVRLRTDDLALGMARGQAGADLQLRLVNDVPHSLVLRYPAYQETGVPRPYAWGGPNAMRWRSASAGGLAVEGGGIHGDLLVRVNEQLETWTLDLTRSGQAVSGSCERRIAPLPEPKAVEGRIEGEARVLADKRTRFSLRLSQAGVQGGGGGPADIDIYIERLADGAILAHGAGGRINQSAFEVDPSRLSVADEVIRGPITVIIHADRYGAPRPDLATALACTYEIDVRASTTEGRVVLGGTYSGRLGVEYRRAVKVSGQVHAGEDVKAEVDLSAAPAPEPIDGD